MSEKSSAAAEAGSESAENPPAPSQAPADKPRPPGGKPGGADGTPSGKPSAPGGDAPKPDEKDAQSYLERAEDEEREWQQRQRNLSDLGEEEASRAGRDWIGRDAYRVTGGTMYSAEGDIFIGVGSRQQVPIRYLTRSEADRMAEWLVEPQSQPELQAAIERESLVFLRGRNGTGRRTAGLAALLKWASATEAIAEHSDFLPVGMILSSAAASAEPKLREQHGYVFDTASSGNPANLANLKDHAERLGLLAERHGCRVAVLVPADWPDSFGRVVDHVPPSSPTVFLRRLEYEADQAGIDQRAFDGMRSEIDEDLRHETSPGNAAWPAGWLVAKFKAGRSADELRAELPQQIRDDIRRRLTDGGTILGRCFMTSAAVLNELPEPIVSGKALRLAEHINQVDNVQNEDRPQAWQHLRSWLEYANAMTRPGAAGSGPKVYLRRRAAKETLRVLWEEQPTIREPLIKWLRETAEDSDPSVSTKAAHAAGILATFDFESAMNRFIFPWSRSRRSRLYQIAAMMLESAVGDPDVAPRVYAFLRFLVAGPRGHRLIAAHALGSRIGLKAPEEALRELRKIALSRDAEASRAVAGSIGNLYSSANAERILSELAWWVESESPAGLYTSALAFVRLAVISNADPDRPALSQLKLNGKITAQLALLWRNSLSLRMAANHTPSLELTVPESWTLLERWVARYANDPGIHSIIDETFNKASTAKALRNALMLYLRHWRNRKKISDDVYDHIVKMMRER
jgi:hypothetical protein